MSIIYNGQTVAGVYAEQILNNADTINAGIIKIATQEEVDTGENNTSAVTPLYLSNKQNKLESGDNISIENDIISCDIKPDVSTIIQNEDGTLTNVGQLTKSGTIKIDWEGTEAEYTRAMLNGEIDPNWYCYITDDESLVDYADVCNQSLSNLRPEGEARFDAKLDKNQITNCLLEVPQRIKLELVDGVLTLKKGSIIVFPRGTEDKTSQYAIGKEFNNSKFKIVDRVFKYNQFFVWVELQTDITDSGSDTSSKKTNRIITLNPSGTILEMGTSRSGDTEYSGTSNCTTYRTDLNLIQYHYSGALQNYNGSLPIATVVSDGVSQTYGSINQIFNGFGYIGNTIWADKGIKALIPNGRNEDGSLNNIEFTTSSVLTQTRNISGTDKPLILRQDQFSNFTVLNYDENTNFNIDAGGNNNQRVIVGTWSADSTGRITSFQPKLPFRAVDYNDFTDEINVLNDTKVSKAGDTMTGNLNINKNGGSIVVTGTAYKSFIGASTDIDYTSTSQVSMNGARLLSTDKNGNWFGYVQSWIDGNGAIRTGFASRRSISGTIKECGIAVGVDTNGNAYTYAPTPPTGDNSTKIATTAFCKNMATTTKATTTSSASATRPAWIVQNYVNGTSWYRVWSDGWIEQGGFIKTTVGANKVEALTFLKAFTKIGYTAVISDYAYSTNDTTTGTSGDVKVWGVTGFTTTGMSIITTASSGRSASWYVCGY